MDEQQNPKDEEQSFEHGQAESRAEETAKPSDVGALDGAAAAGSPAAAGTDSDDEGIIPTAGPDPTIGPD